MAQKKQEQAQFEWEQLDRRKEEIAEEQGKLDAERAEMNADMNRKIAAAETREKELESSKSTKRDCRMQGEFGK